MPECTGCRVEGSSETSAPIVTSLEELAKEFDLETDSRFRRWAKVIPSLTPVTPLSVGGYALGGNFERGHFVVRDGDYVVLAAESGSRTHHSYEYRLLKNIHGKMVRVRVPNERIRLLPLSSDKMAKSLNSTLYAYACAIELGLTPEPNDESPPSVTNPESPPASP